MTDSQCPAYAGNYVSLYLFLLFIAQKNSLENIGQLDMLTLMFKKYQHYCKATKIYNIVQGNIAIIL